jgi:hypothetical protein
MILILRLFRDGVLELLEFHWKADLFKFKLIVDLNYAITYEISKLGGIIRRGRKRFAEILKI